MAAVNLLLPPGPRPREVWLTFGMAVLLHGLLVATVILMPRFQFGHYITVPVSYTVSLVDAPPGGRGGGSPSPPPPPAASPPSPPPAQPAAPPRPAPAVRPAPRPEEELTLPSRRPPPVRPREAEPSLLPPELRPRTSAPPRAVPPAPPPAQPAAPAAPPAPAVASAGNGVGSGVGEATHIELAGPAGGGGGTALNAYLTMVDWKIRSNWTPLASGSTPVVVRFRVLRSGEVRDVQLETSSGDNNLDIAAMRAIRQSTPLPPFINSLTEPYLDLRYLFYAERG